MLQLCLTARFLLTKSEILVISGFFRNEIALSVLNIFFQFFEFPDFLNPSDLQFGNEFMFKVEEDSNFNPDFFFEFNGWTSILLLSSQRFKNIVTI